MPRFQDRRHGGRVLAEHLARLALPGPLVVLGLPRGGVPVAAEVAKRLGAPLDVVVVRKLGLPEQPELAMGAVASGGVRVLNEDVVQAAGVSQATIDAVTERERRELERREVAFRGGAPQLDLEGRTVIVVDDGLATGATMRAAIAAVRRLRPSRVLAAAPVAAKDTCDAFAAEGMEITSPFVPADFMAVGAWYEDFPQTSDDEVREILEQARAVRTR